MNERLREYVVIVRVGPMQPAVFEAVLEAPSYQVARQWADEIDGVPQVVAGIVAAPDRTGS